MVGVPGRSIKSVTVIPLGTITSGELNAHGKPRFVCAVQNNSRIAFYDFCGLIRLYTCVRVCVCAYVRYVRTNVGRYVRMRVRVCVCACAYRYGMYVDPYMCMCMHLLIHVSV